MSNYEIKDTWTKKIYVFMSYDAIKDTSIKEILQGHEYSDCQKPETIDVPWHSGVSW